MINLFQCHHGQRMGHRNIAPHSRRPCHLGSSQTGAMDTAPLSETSQLALEEADRGERSFLQDVLWPDNDRANRGSGRIVLSLGRCPRADIMFSGVINLNRGMCSHTRVPRFQISVFIFQPQPRMTSGAR